MLERPYVLSGLGIMWGYVKAMLGRQERFENREYLRHFRRYELRSLVLGKRRTMQAYHERVRSSFPPPAQRHRAAANLAPGAFSAAGPNQMIAHAPSASMRT
jgi:hypothetical protein